MQVEVAEKLEISASPRPQGGSRALESFLSAINGEESLIRVETCSVGGEPRWNAEGIRSCCHGFIVRFSEASRNREQVLYFMLLEKLTELLKNSGSADSLKLRVELSREGAPGSGRVGIALVLQLCAAGATVEQAQIRWDLGVVHLQQALLFTSRLLRHKFAAI